MEVRKEDKVIKLSEEQYKTLQEGLHFYYNHLSQPNEMAVDFTKKRKAIYDLLEYIDAYSGKVTVKKLVNGEWVQINE